MDGFQGGADGTSALKLAAVPTDNFKERLNSIYKIRRLSQHPLSNSGLFEYLWDLKEIALLEGQPSVQVPAIWLQELEADLQWAASANSIGHG